ncbi:hypothetical protein GGS20DRAFT_47226 [Poronia punctata]|nr:hypothetical protein GGS20DRAFT_47226 [Poronia punctata]
MSEHASPAPDVNLPQPQRRRGRRGRRNGRNTTAEVQRMQHQEVLERLDRIYGALQAQSRIQPPSTGNYANETRPGPVPNLGHSYLSNLSYIRRPTRFWPVPQLPRDPPIPQFSAQNDAARMPFINSYSPNLHANPNIRTTTSIHANNIRPPTVHNNIISSSGSNDLYDADADADVDITSNPPETSTSGSEVSALEDPPRQVKLTETFFLLGLELRLTRDRVRELRAGLDANVPTRDYATLDGNAISHEAAMDSIKDTLRELTDKLEETLEQNIQRLISIQDAAREMTRNARNINVAFPGTRMTEGDDNRPVMMPGYPPTFYHFPPTTTTTTVPPAPVSAPAFAPGLAQQVPGHPVLDWAHVGCSSLAHHV